MFNKKRLFVLCIIIIISQLAVAQVVDVELIHWNDFHSANLPYTPTSHNPDKIQVGGSANLAGYIDSLRNIYSDALVVNAGDDFQGSPVSSITKGLSQILLMNKINPDAYTIGNHEFDYGKESLYDVISKAKFPVLTGNIYDDEKNKMFSKPYTIVEKGDAKIAIIGVVYESLKSSVIPANVEGLTILDPVKQIQKYVDEVKDKSDMIVVLSHSGFHEDSVYATQVTDVDVIVGGHSHSYISKPLKVNDCLVVQAGARGERLGLLKMKLDKATGKIGDYHYDFIRTELGKVKPDAEVAALVDSMESKIAQVMDEQIGTLEKDWVRNSRDESNIGNWICDATKDYFDVDIMLQNSGGIRKNLPAGPIRTRDIWEISPFDNTIQIIELTGQQVIDMINYRLENPRDLLQIGGLKMYIDYKKGILKKASINDKEILLDKKYTIATNNYIMSHADRFFGIDPKTLKVNDTNVLGRDVLLDAVKKQKVISGDLEDRMIDVSEK